MKLLIISNLYPPYVLGGYEILCHQVSNELKARGHQVVVLTSTHGVEDGVEDGVQDDPSENIHRVFKLYLPFTQKPRLLRHRRWLTGRYNYRVAEDFIKREKPDLIFVWSQLRLTVGSARAALDSGIPTAFTFNDVHIGEFMPAHFNWAPRGLYRHIADHWVFPSITLKGITLDHTTCISRRLKSNLMEYGMPIENSKIIYQGIPIERFPMKDDIGKIHSPVRALYVGQLHTYKGVHTFIDAAHRIVREKGPKYLQVSIVGGGTEEYKSQLIKQVADGPACIKFGGQIPHDELPQVYRDNDIFVFSSIWQEPFGLTHLEAMASGTPVISTADGGHGEFLEDNVNS
ncbi:MAG: glycosyltransferase, partial [Candidatus Electryoneaceae bacterium]|nr:glycosyltransferase [Candidatus Electryoneaceae bacterium]